MSELLLERIAKAAEEQLRWTRFLGMSQLKSILEHNLKTDEDKLIYELSDGERSTRDIEKIVQSASRTKIALLWSKWYKMHIMERSAKYSGKRMKRVFSLAEAGIDIPPMPAASTQESGPSTNGEEFE